MQNKKYIKRLSFNSEYYTEKKSKKKRERGKQQTTKTNKNEGQIAKHRIVPLTHKINQYM
jgi:hypothetical protein